jgi:uncharacterized membrane protein
MVAQYATNSRPLIAAGTLLGAGLGGFFDGILLHQILQTHNMLSAIIPPDTLVNAKVNMVWDGLFHSLTWLMTVLGIAVLWSAGGRNDVPWSGSTLSGAALMGWGLFNFVEGLIDHHILGIHHVVERLGLSVYDYVFLGTGVLFIGLGVGVIRVGRANIAQRQEPARGR